MPHVDKDAQSMRKPQDSVDKTLVTINATALFGYLFVFQISELDSLTRYALLLSLILFVISLLALLWYLHRFPIRYAHWEKLAGESSNKYADRIATFMENIVGPLAELTARQEITEKISKSKTRQEAQKIIKQLQAEKKSASSNMSAKEEQAYRYVIEGFVTQVQLESKDNYRTAFLKPLDEQHSRLKNYLDRFSFKFRRQLFASASIVLLFAVIISLLSR